MMGALAGRGVAWLANLAVVATLLLLIGLPLTLVLVQSFVPALFDPLAPSFALDVGSLARTLGEPRLLRSILNSLLLASAVSVSATALGACFALAISRTDVPWRGVFGSTPWLVFLTPSYLKALSWILLMAPGGYFAQFGLSWPALSEAFFGPVGLIFVHTLNLFPLPYFVISAALAGLGSEYEDAARMAGVRLSRCWTHINLPLLAPAFALCFIAIYAEVLSDFGLASTIARVSDFGLLTYGIYSAASTYPVDFALAGTQALVLLLLVAALVLADRLLRRQVAARLISGRSRPVRVYSLGVWRWPVAAVIGFIAFVALVLPIVTIATRAFCRTLDAGLHRANFTTQYITRALTWHDPNNEALVRSLGFALATASIAAGMALLLSLRLDGANRILRPMVLALALGTVAIPGIVLGFGYILVWDRLPVFRDLPFPRYGSSALLVMGYIGAALPYCLVIILTAVGQLAPSLSEAARLNGVGWLRRMVAIVLPLVSLSVVTAFLFTFIRSVFELPMSELLVPVTGPAAASMIVHLFGKDDDGLGSALSVVAMIIVAIASSVVWLLAQTAVRRRLHAPPGRPVLATEVVSA